MRAPILRSGAGFFFRGSLVTAASRADARAPGAEQRPAPQPVADFSSPSAGEMKSGFV